MKRLLFVCLLAFSATGCATTGGVVSPVSTNDVGAIIAKVQAATRTVCGFVPIASTISGLLGGDIIDAFAIAQAICSAVTPAPPPLGIAAYASAAGPVVVNTRRNGNVTAQVRGVTIKGRFAKGESK